MTLDQQFEQYDKANPHVYETLLGLSMRAVRAGRKRLGIKQLFEVARWELSFTTNGDPFKLNNNFHSRYARKLMREVPELRGVFYVRELKRA